MAGRTAPIKQPLLNAQVFGQDSVQRAIYHGQIHWFWGDTNRASYPLGHFGMSGAVSDLPDHGGLNPDVGINYTYFTDPTGFARPMVPGQNLRWIDGLIVLKDDKGNDRLVAKCEMLKTLGQSLGRKLIVYNDEKNAFDDLAPLDRNEQLCPQGPSLRHTDNGVDYVYFANPFATLRVRADWKTVQTPSEYEGFTCLAPGTRYSRSNPTIERDPAGNLVWAWKKNTPPINSRQQADLVKAGLLKPDQTWNDPHSADGKETVFAHAGGVEWNDYRKKWIAIFTQQGGKSSLLGEIWYAEADQPHGPFRRATKIVTHDHYTFYNPVHHPFFDQDGGRTIYFEGTYCNTFSGNPQQTPRYDYNQVMYKLDLSDPRLRMPAE
jgi:hypothetical protein